MDSWAPFVWPSRLPCSSCPGPSLLPSAMVSVCKTGHLPSGPFPRFPKLVQNLPLQVWGNLPKFFCKASLYPRKGTGEGSHGQLPRRPRPLPVESRPPESGEHVQDAGLLGKSAKRVPTSALDLHFWGHLSEMAQPAFNSSLGKWRWPCPSGSWHCPGPDALPSRLQWKVASGGVKWHRAFCVPGLLPCNCHKRKHRTTPFWLTAHAPGKSTSQRTLANGLLPISF